MKVEQDIEGPPEITYPDFVPDIVVSFQHRQMMLNGNNQTMAFDKFFSRSA